MKSNPIIGVDYPGISGYSGLKEFVDNTTSKSFENVYADEYTQQLAETIYQSEVTNEVIRKAKVSSNYSSTAFGQLSRQLRSVSEVMAARCQRKAQRDFFYVSEGG